MSEKEPVTLENFEALTVEDLKAELDAREVAYEAGDLKADLQKKLKKSLRAEAKAAVERTEVKELTEEEVLDVKYNANAPAGETIEQRTVRANAENRAAHSKAFSEYSDEDKEKGDIETGKFGDIVEGEAKEMAERGDIANRQVAAGETPKSTDEDRRDHDAKNENQVDVVVAANGEEVAAAPNNTKEFTDSEQGKTEMPLVPQAPVIEPNLMHKAEDVVNPKGVANDEQPSIYENNKIDVYDGKRFVRTYDGAVHGTNFKKLAEDFAMKNNYQLVQHRNGRDGNLQEARAESEQVMRDANEITPAQEIDKAEEGDKE